MTKALIQNVKKWINAFPSNAGITGPYSPANIVDGSINPDCQRKRIVYGAYALAYAGTNTNMTSRAVPAISLYESNDFDGQFFMNLETAQRFHSKRWSQLPIDDTVIDRIVKIATKEKQPNLPGGTPIFEWAPGLEIQIDEYMDSEDEDSSDDNDDETLN